MANPQPFPRWQQPLPTMYDLPSEDPEEPGLPDEFHALQPQLLSQTCQVPEAIAATRLMAQDLNLYYDPRHTQWYKRPDWFIALGVRPVERQEELRWSYVVWQEGVAPFLVVELLSPGTESDDLGYGNRDRQPPSKWEVYEQILHIPYYVVFDRRDNRFRAFRLEGERYQPLELPRRKLWLESLDLGLGVWDGRYNGVEGQWLRWYNSAGIWIPTPEERAETEAQRAEAEAQRAEAEAQRAEAEAQRAEAEAQRAEAEA
ncbi:Uma2 family endonuclease, partial [Spirulina subsalsa CS-330]|uniref:Uma2 family endonuclease n=2 Tax=Spirulina TaxID=1154 RepID=UPI00232F8083